MNCAEFQKALPEFAEPQRDTALQAHLRSCSDCSLLVSDLDSIVAAAPSLAASEDPNPQIWLQLEAALKNEGLIRQPAAPLVAPFVGIAGRGCCRFDNRTVGLPAFYTPKPPKYRKDGRDRACCSRADCRGYQCRY
jgi:hypothetical protein